MRVDTIARARRSRIRHRGFLAKAAEEGRDVLFEAWSERCPRVPAPSVFAAARLYGGEALCLRLIRRLAWEGKLSAYSERDFFAKLVLCYVQAGFLRREAA